MAHGDAVKWRGNWRIEWVASTLHTTSENGVSSITTVDAHTTAASSRLNWRPPADLNGLVRFAEKRNLVSARVPSHFNCPSTSRIVSCVSPYSREIQCDLYGYIYDIVIACCSYSPWRSRPHHHKYRRFLSCCLAETLPHLSKYISICMTSLRVTKCSDPLMVAARIFTGCLKLHSTLQYSLCVRACCVCEIVHNWVLLYTVSSVHVTKCPVPSWRITLLRSVRPHLTVTCASKSERLRTYVL